MELRINSWFKNILHLTQTKGRSLDYKRFYSKNVRGFIAHSKHFTNNVKLVRSPYLGLLMFLLISIKSKINKKSVSRILTT